MRRRHASIIDSAQDCDLLSAHLHLVKSFPLPQETFPRTDSGFYFTGTRQARGEVRHKVRLQGVQPRVPAAEGHEPRDHQVLPQQRRSPDRRGAASGSGRRRETHPHRASLGARC